MQECYSAWLYHRAKSQPVHKTTKKFKLWWKLLSLAADVEWTIHQNECQQSVNDLSFCKYGNYTVIWSLLCITDILAPLLAKETATWSLPHSWYERQWNINDCSFASWIIYVLIGWRHLFIRYWLPWLGKTPARCSLPRPENECQHSINDF